MHTFVLCPLLVIAFELALNRGRLTVMPWGAPLLAWGYWQYRLVRNYRLPRAGGTPGMDAMPERIIAAGPYHYTRNAMYLGHLIFMAGLVLTFWSWFALILLICLAPATCCARRETPRTNIRRRVFRISNAGEAMGPVRIVTMMRNEAASRRALKSRKETR